MNESVELGAIKPMPPHEMVRVTTLVSGANDGFTRIRLVVWEVYSEFGIAGVNLNVARARMVMVALAGGVYRAASVPVTVKVQVTD